MDTFLLLNRDSGIWDGWLSSVHYFINGLISAQHSANFFKSGGDTQILDIEDPIPLLRKLNTYFGLVGWRRREFKKYLKGSMTAT